VERSSDLDLRGLGAILAAVLLRRGGREHGWESANTANETNEYDSWSSQHGGGAQFVLCDGAVRFLSETIDLNTFSRLCNRKDGMTLGDY